jgi:hypothetical protein
MVEYFVVLYILLVWCLGFGVGYFVRLLPDFKDKVKRKKSKKVV